MTAQGTEAGTGETEGLDAKRDGPVDNVDAPNPPKRCPITGQPYPTPRDSYESESI